MVRVKLIAFTAALLAAQPSYAVPPVPVPAVPAPAASRPAASKELALELARLGQPTALLVEGVLKGYDLAAAKEKEHPGEETIALEKEYPGFLDKLRARGREELIAIMTERAPVLHEKLADVYVANLSDANMRQVISFFQTPTGKKFIRSMAMSPPGNAADDLKLTEAEVADASKSAAAYSLKQMSADEWVELVKFGTSPAGRANRAVNAKVEPVVATVLTELMTDFAKRMQPITMELLEQYSKADGK
jgi:hypothetical protein